MEGHGTAGGHLGVEIGLQAQAITIQTSPGAAAAGLEA